MIDKLSHHAANTVNTNALLTWQCQITCLTKLSNNSIYIQTRKKNGIPIYEHNGVCVAMATSCMVKKLIIRLCHLNLPLLFCPRNLSVCILPIVPCISIRTIEHSKVVELKLFHHVNIIILLLQLQDLNHPLIMLKNMFLLKFTCWLELILTIGILVTFVGPCRKPSHVFFIRFSLLISQNFFSRVYVLFSNLYSFRFALLFISFDPLISYHVNFPFAWIICSSLEILINLNYDISFTFQICYFKTQPYAHT